MLYDMSKSTGKSRSELANASLPNEGDERFPSPDEALSLPTFITGPGTLDRLVERWSRKFGPAVKMDCLMRDTIQNDKEKEPCAGVQSQSCA